MRRAYITAAVLGAALAPRFAAAGNGLHPRTPVEWPPDVPCMTVVDRSQGTVLKFPYGIPYEDTDVTPDEVPDSRRHQFVAFCRSHSPQDPLPTWLSWADVGAAVTAGLLQMSDVSDPEVMETNAIYKDCFWRITPDDARRPIVFAEAMKGVEWDTAGLPAGGYVVEGYTWEPVYNIWSRRPGVIHVVDGPDLAAVPPALAVEAGTDVIFSTDTLGLKGCVRAMPGATLSGYWSLTKDALDWKPFAEGVPLTGDAFELPYMPDPTAVGQTVALRVDVTDPMQRSFSGYPPMLLSVLPGGSGTTGCGDSGSIIGGESCGDSDTSGGPSATTSATGGGSSGSGGASSGGGSSGGTSAATGVNEPEPTACGCGAGGDAGLAGLFVLVGIRGRRKRGSTLGAR